MSDYVEQNSKAPYEYDTKKATKKFTKVIYADDGTYFQQTREGAQKIVNAISNFATTTGIIIKPEKSYIYSNQKGNPIMITTYDGKDENNKLKNKQKQAMKELGDKDYFRHLGNVQNAQGHNPLKTTEMHDGTIYENIEAKTRRNLTNLRARNITPAGVRQIIKMVVEKQILYPLTYANITKQQTREIAKEINKTIRTKYKIPKHIHTSIMHSHESAGGLGENDIWDIVQTHRLVLLAQCLQQKGEMEIIMNGAIERLQEQACIQSNPLQTKITHFMTNQTQTWLYPLKIWMEENNIIMSDDPEPLSLKKETGILDACIRKREGKKYGNG